MITVVGLNPALDITLELDQLIPGETNRYHRQREVLAGKALNVIRLLAALGQRAAYLGYVPENSELTFEQTLTRLNQDLVSINIPGTLRHNYKLKVMDNITELNGQGSPVPQAARHQLKEKLQKLLPQTTCLVLTGSLPPGEGNEVYRHMAEMAESQGVPVILDASGAALAEGVKARPTLFKPNREELAALGRKAQDLSQEANICLSLGSEGSVFYTKEQVYSYPGRALNIKTTVGAGDAMVAGFAWGLANHLSWQQSYGLAVGLAEHHIEMGWQAAAERLNPKDLIREVRTEEVSHETD